MIKGGVDTLDWDYKLLLQVYHTYLQGSASIIEGLGVRQESEEGAICSQIVFVELSRMAANSRTL